MGWKGAWLAVATAASIAFGGGAVRAQTATDYTTYFQRDLLGRPTMTVGPLVDGLRRIERVVYDIDGQVSETDVGTVAGVSLDAAGNVSVTGLSILQTVTNRYDVVGNKTQVHANPGTAAASLTQTYYDPDDKPVCVAVRMNSAAFADLFATTDRPDACALTTPGTLGPDRIAKTTYDAAGQVKRIDQAVGTADTRIYARYEYTDNGKQREIVDANGNKTTLTYDGFDRLDRQTFPSTTRPNPGQVGVSNAADYEQYLYDANGNRLSLRKRDGAYVRYCYDALNRQVIKRATSNVADCQAAGAADDVYNSYDLGGRPLSVRFQSTSGQGVTYAYDTAGRMTGETTFGRAVSFESDAAGNRTKMTWPDGMVLSYGVDAASRLKTLGLYDWAAFLTYGYDSLNRRTSASYFSGVRNSYCYDAAGRLAAWSMDLAGGELPAGALNCATAAQTAANGFAVQGGANKDQIEAFGYNPASQVVSHARANGVYQWTTNASSLSATADGLNRDQAIATIGGGGCAASGKGYDCNGNLTNDGARTFAYDRENRLVSMAGLAAAGLDYDPLGRLAKTTINGVVTQFLYDGDQLIAEYDGAGALLRRYAHGVGADDPVMWWEGASYDQPRVLHADRQGSIMGWSDASGTSQAVYTYGPYGEPGDNWAAGSRFRYTGQAALPELKLYHYKARVYDPMRGWFLQTDPIGYKDDLDLYAYVGNDPLNHGDPTGLYQGWDDAAVMTAGALGGVAGQFLGDLAGGTKSDWQSYAGAAVGGAITAEGTYYATTLTAGAGTVAGSMAAGAAGNAAGEATAQLLRGKGFDKKEIAVAAGVGAVTNVPGGFALKGVNAGRNSMNAVAKQVTTKVMSGQIKNVSLKTWGKIVTANIAEGANSTQMAALANVTKNHLQDFKEGACRLIKCK